VLVDQDKLGPGETGLAQFVLESLTTAAAKDRFVIRGFSSMRAIGGGVVLDAHPQPHKRLDSAVIEKLAALESDAGSAIEQVFLKSGVTPLSVAKAASAVGISENEAAEVVNELHEAGRLARVGGSQDHIHADSCRELAAKLVGIIEDYYARNPYRVLMPVADLQSRFGKMASRPVYETVIAGLAGEGIIVEQASRIGLAKRQINWKPGEEELARRIERLYEQAGHATPPEEDVAADLRVSQATFESIMTALIDQGRLVRLAERVTYHAKAVESARRVIVEHIAKHGGITAAELRDKMGVTRKYAIALLEYLDNSQVTRRLGDKRVLR
jgi:selenocysteine-specific elongation factor